eukprot:TRINITY_DN5866_c0_g1_i2.p1 TRINITY_DN5866_c0_g1~~TRINITY_DN5866_c0_g1_i2.p1  ORF type:complete len:579 (+),score=140.08 TRINITY_DN5866_c0_g1_i2:31-1737(+)
MKVSVLLILTLLVMIVSAEQHRQEEKNTQQPKRVLDDSRRFVKRLFGVGWGEPTESKESQDSQNSNIESFMGQTADRFTKTVSDIISGGQQEPGYTSASSSASTPEQKMDEQGDVWQHIGTSWTKLRNKVAGPPKDDLIILDKEPTWYAGGRSDTELQEEEEQFRVQQIQQQEAGKPGSQEHFELACHNDPSCPPDLFQIYCDIIGYGKTIISDVNITICHPEGKNCTLPANCTLENVLSGTGNSSNCSLPDYCTVTRGNTVPVTPTNTNNVTLSGNCTLVNGTYVGTNCTVNNSTNNATNFVCRVEKVFEYQCDCPLGYQGKYCLYPRPFTCAMITHSPLPSCKARSTENKENLLDSDPVCYEVDDDATITFEHTLNCTYKARTMETVTGKYDHGEPGTNTRGTDFAFYNNGMMPTPFFTWKFFNFFSMGDLDGFTRQRLSVQQFLGKERFSHSVKITDLKPEFYAGGRMYAEAGLQQSYFKTSAFTTATQEFYDVGWNRFFIDPKTNKGRGEIRRRVTTFVFPVWGYIVIAVLLFALILIIQRNNIRKEKAVKKGNEKIEKSGKNK